MSKLFRNKKNRNRGDGASSSNTPTPENEPARTNNASGSNQAPVGDAAEPIDQSNSYVLSLWNLIIRPPRRTYTIGELGSPDFRCGRNCTGKREDFTLRNERGLKLVCSLYTPVFLGGAPAPEKFPVVIYLHGNASGRPEALSVLPFLLPRNIAVCSFDFAGCGNSEGEYVSLGWYERDDLKAVVEHLRMNVPQVVAIGLWGRSMGAVTALMHAERDHALAGMVLDSPFANLRQLIGEIAQSPQLNIKIPSFLVSGACGIIRMMIQNKAGFNIDDISPIDRVSTSFIPAFFLAASGDDFIPCHHAKDLKEKYGGESEYLEVDGDHNSNRPLDSMKSAADFFRRAFPVEILYFPPDGHEPDLMNIVEQMEIEAALAERARRHDLSSEAAGPALLRQIMQHHTRLQGAELRESFNCTGPFRLDMAAQFTSPPGSAYEPLIAGFAFRANIAESESEALTLFAIVEFFGNDTPAKLTLFHCQQKNVPVPPDQCPTPPQEDGQPVREKIMNSLFVLGSETMSGDRLQDGIPFLVSFEVGPFPDNAGTYVVVEVMETSIRARFPVEVSKTSTPDLFTISRGVMEATTIYEVTKLEPQVGPDLEPSTTQTFEDGSHEPEEAVLLTPRDQPTFRRVSAPPTRQERLEQREKRREEARKSSEYPVSPDRPLKRIPDADNSANAFPKTSPRPDSEGSEKDCSIQ